jgi:hypothetical protein
MLWNFIYIFKGLPLIFRTYPIAFCILGKSTSTELNLQPKIVFILGYGYEEVGRVGKGLN